jgi:hypothetical protein
MEKVVVDANPFEVQNFETIFQPITLLQMCEVLQKLRPILV